ncbi:MAG: hypothetical protein VX700_09530 [Pseudomonadota bacterium]|nr:hypothetical protein [Pseudomonadota bacterium]
MTEITTIYTEEKAQQPGDIVACTNLHVVQEPQRLPQPDRRPDRKKSWCARMGGGCDGARLPRADAAIGPQAAALRAINIYAVQTIAQSLRDM